MSQNFSSYEPAVITDDAAPVLTTDRAVSAYPAPAEGSAASTTDSGQGKVADVKDTAKESGQHVADVAKDQVGNVATEAKNQARDLLTQGQDELRQQTAQQQERLASGLHSLSDELHSMASGSTDQGLAADLTREAAERTRVVAGWLEHREPGELLDEVKSFARQRPGAFLGIAAVAGVLVGRLGRGLKEGEPQPSDRGADHQPSAQANRDEPTMDATTAPGDLTGTAGYGSAITAPVVDGGSDPGRTL